MKNLILLALLAPALILAGCSDDTENTNPIAPSAVEEFPEAPAGMGETEFAAARTATADIVDTAVAAGFSTLAAAVEAAEFVDLLKSEGPFTVFAPSNEAFAALPAGLLDALLLPENKEKLQQILAYHVISGAAVESGDLRFYQKVETAEGSEVRIIRYRRLILVNDARVTLADVGATNGVIHAINKVLIPEGFTLDEPAEPTADIVDTAIAAGFDTLVGAVQAADLEGALRGEGPLTVFAPSEAAFAALPSETVEFLLAPENVAYLQELLTYHVLAGEVRSTDLKGFQVVRMFNGAWAIIRKWGSDVRINRAQVETADVLATNGVIHAIDKVLIPYTFFGHVAGLPDEAPEDHPGHEQADTSR